MCVTAVPFVGRFAPIFEQCGLHFDPSSSEDATAPGDCFQAARVFTRLLPALSKRKPSIVPKYATEEMFYASFFSHVLALAREVFVQRNRTRTYEEEEANPSVSGGGSEASSYGGDEGSEGSGSEGSASGSYSGESYEDGGDGSGSQSGSGAAFSDEESDGYGDEDEDEDEEAYLARVEEEGASQEYDDGDDEDELDQEDEDDGRQEESGGEDGDDEAARAAEAYRAWRDVEVPGILAKNNPHAMDIDDVQKDLISELCGLDDELLNFVEDSASLPRHVRDEYFAALLAAAGAHRTYTTPVATFVPLLDEFDFGEDGGEGRDVSPVAVPRNT